MNRRRCAAKEESEPGERPSTAYALLRITTAYLYHGIEARPRALYAWACGGVKRVQAGEADTVRHKRASLCPEQKKPEAFCLRLFIIQRCYPRCLSHGESCTISHPNARTWQRLTRASIPSRLTAFPLFAYFQRPAGPRLHCPKDKQEMLAATEQQVLAQQDGSTALRAIKVLGLPINSGG